jgi:rfaE bifunctional protein nucleotidyltransferase chain/domain
MELNNLGFVNGCFDVLHIGHVRMLQFAKEKCDHLIVAIDTDSRVKQLKGCNRPINNHNDRREFLMALSSVDEVKMFSTDDELIDLINLIKPDIMIVGSDYQDKKVIGSQHAKQLIFFDRIKGYSTSKIVEDSGSR